MEPSRQFGYREADARSLDVGVAHAAGADEVRSADVAPDQIIRVIDHAHLVGFGVTDAKLDVVVRK